MVLGALLDAGLEEERLEAELAKLNMGGYRLVAERVKRNGLAGTHVEVEIEESQVARHLHHIRDIIQGSALAPSVKERSIAVFERLARAEAKVHGEPVDQVHFHEVGAMDAIIDVVGAIAGLWLLGVEQVFSSHVHIGRGTVRCAHGELPVPAPATAELLREVPTYGRDVESELVTPTGAAILTTLASGYGAAPPMRSQMIGYGAGSRILPLPNLLRLTVGELLDGGDSYLNDSVIVVETNIDDMNPQAYDHVMRRLFQEARALDVFLTGIQMKRNRPGTQLSVLVNEDGLPAVLEVIFRETSAIGVRSSRVDRFKLARERIEVDTHYGIIGVKVARRRGEVLNVAPEYVECRQAARTHGVALAQVMRIAQQAVWDRLQDDA
jgi:uncharacterized protein (TIGR00299 family) protein